MSIVDSHLELEILFDNLVEEFVKAGKSYEWIQDTLTDVLAYAIEDHEESVKEKYERS